MVMGNYFITFTSYNLSFILWDSDPQIVAVFKAAILIFSKKPILPGWSNFLLFTCLQVANCHLFIAVLFGVREDIKRALKITID